MRVAERARETLEALGEEITTARIELEYHEAEAAARRALLVELETALEALGRRAGAASSRRRVLDGRTLPP
jgi:hypothetical protein